MTHLDIELKMLKKEGIEMFELVASQLLKAKTALLHNDKELARSNNRSRLGATT